jgi:radical SAM superfamily enzyme YgiQ (UPF0313 family)
MRVLLISANTEQFNMPAMPLGLACVAEATKRAGHEVLMLDLMFQADVSSTLKEAISEAQPECIGISVRNIDDQCSESPQFLIEKVKQVVTVCRTLSASPIVLGGAGYSMFPESALAYLEADYGVAGEGETAFNDLLTHLHNNEDPSGIPGLYIKGEGSKESKILCRNLDKFSLPETSILSASASQSHEPWIPVQTRRGCALRCSYCSTSTIEGAILRKRSPEIVSAWLESWVNAGYVNFFFVDNTFNLPPAYARALCRQILERKLHMNWRCIIYPDKVDNELVDLMVAAGCRQISLGFESGSEQMLKNLNKQFTLDDVRAVSEIFAEKGIEQMGFLLLGGPGETRRSVEESLAFTDTLKLDALRVTSGIRIYPDTALADTSINQGIISPQTNLLYPHFYLSPDLEGWLSKRLREWQASRPHVIM